MNAGSGGNRNVRNVEKTVCEALHVFRHCASGQWPQKSGIKLGTCLVKLQTWRLRFSGCLNTSESIYWPLGWLVCYIAHDVNIKWKKDSANSDWVLLLCHQFFVPRCGELHADRQPGAEEVGLPLLNELRQEPAWHGHHGRQQLCQGKALNELDLFFQLCIILSGYPMLWLHLH